MYLYPKIDRSVKNWVQLYNFYFLLLYTSYFIRHTKPKVSCLFHA